jgi:hypothetical protein
VEVEIEWTGGRAARAALRPSLDGTRRVRPPRGQQLAAVTVGGVAVATVAQADGSVSVPMTPGREYVVTFR